MSQSQTPKQQPGSARKLERLQKVLAEAGVASRRKCEQLITGGLIRVNGKVVDTLPVLVDATSDKIEVDGTQVHNMGKVYFALNKPRGVVCTNHDPAGRQRVIDLIKGCRARIFSVGRLDVDSGGLILLTNDGEFANQLTHPRYGVPKTYLAEVDGRISAEHIEQMKQGVFLAEGKVKVHRAEIIRRSRNRTIMELTLREGRNRQIRRMLARLDQKVRRLIRIRIGSLDLGGLKPGQYRSLSTHDVQQLQKKNERRTGRAKG